MIDSSESAQFTAYFLRKAGLKQRHRRLHFKGEADEVNMYLVEGHTEYVKAGRLRKKVE